MLRRSIVLALDGFTWAAIGQITRWPGADIRTASYTLHIVQQSNWNLPFYVGGLAWIIGLVILSVGLLRTKLIWAWAGWLFALGVVLVGLETAIESNTYFIIASCVLAIGGVGVGLSLINDRDTDSTGIGNVPAG